MQGAGVVNLNGTRLDQNHSNSASLKVDRATVRAYLTEMYLDVPGLLQIWSMPEKGSGAFFETTEEGIEQAVTFVEAQWDLTGAQSIYSRITTMKGKPQKEGSRGVAADSSHFIALWTDLDFGTTGHAATDIPADAATAQAVYDATGLPEASITVHSGGGLYHIVKLAEPFDVRDDETRMRIAALSRRWQQRVGDTAKKMGYGYDRGVSDLARVLRIPGTINAKDWRNKRKGAFMSSGARYTIEELEAACPVPPKPPARTFTTSGEPAKDARERFEHHLAEMRATTNRRNDALNRLAYMAFQYAAAGQLDADEVEQKFIEAGLDSGLDDHETPRTVRSAREAGLANPFVWKDFTRPAKAAKGAPAPKDDMWAGELDDNGQVSDRTPVRPSPPAPAPPAEKTEPVTEAAETVAPETTTAPPPAEPPAPPATGTKHDEPGALPSVDITNERDGLHNLVKMIDHGALPEVYVRDGRLVHVGVVSGARNGRRKKPKAAAERAAPDMNASQLRALIARYAYSYAYNEKGVPKPKLPTEALCKAVLATTEWPGLPDLVEITPMPFVREDGTICQKRGYDEQTGVWLNVDEGFPEVPASPTAEQIAEAKELLLDQVLRDFPFVGPADRANYMGLLLTPALKRVTGDVTMFGVITAATAASGKSLLAEIISRVYGGNGDAITLPRQDEELRKLITTQLVSNPHAVVTFDNIGKSHRVDSAVLSSLMTLPVWSDRLLGGNENVSRVNDKLWLGTGNNVQLGGEMASRSLMVRIDPKMERPDKRDTEKFVLGNLQTWMSNEDNRIKVMHALLILIKAWAAAGMPKSKIDVRTFTTWASHIAGLLDFHGITGFHTNADEVDEADEESYEWAVFLAAWHARHGDAELTTAQLLASYRNTQFDVLSGGVDPWNGAFPLRDNGQPYTSRGLGMKLKYIVDRPFQGWVLRKHLNKSTKMQMWRAERMQEGPPPPEQMELPAEDTPTPPVPAPRTARPVTTPLAPAERLHQVRGSVNTLIRTLDRPVNTSRARHEEDRQ